MDKSADRKIALTIPCSCAEGSMLWPWLVPLAAYNHALLCTRASPGWSLLWAWPSSTTGMCWLFNPRCLC